MPEHAQDVMYRQEEVAHTKYVQRLAGVSANDLSEILTKYHILLEFEMNQRGFSLSTGWTQPRNPDQRIQAGIQWWRLMVLKPANSFCTTCSRHGAKVAGVRSTFFT